MEISGPSRRGQYVYQILNTETGAVYIGSTRTTIRYRANAHKNDLLSGSHACRTMQMEWNQCGSAAFLAGVLEVVKERDDLTARESYWIQAYLLAGIRLYNNSRGDWTRLHCDLCGDNTDPLGRSRYCSSRCKLKAQRARRRRPPATPRPEPEE